MALVVGGSRKTTNRCSECGAEMEHRGRARAEIRGIEALFDVYLCGRCLAVQLVSYGDGRIYRKFASKFGPRGTIKLCVSCRSRIPMASEECQFCGSKQPSWEELKRKRSRDLEMMVGGRSFVKACIGCGSRIPIASEKCEFCGSKQPSWRELQTTT